MAEDPMSLWRAWFERAASMMPAGEAGLDPLGASVETYRQFVESTQQALAAGAEGAGRDGLVEVVERIRAALAGADGDAVSGWYAVPVAWAATSLGAPAVTAWEDVESTWSSWAGEFLELPALGPQREWIGAWQGLARALLEQERAFRRLSVHYREAAAAGLKQFAEVLHSDEQTLDSMRTAYDAWVECAEAAYHEAVMTDAFSKDFGAWVNASSRARQRWNAVNERVAAAGDVPARSEVDRLRASQAELTAELAALRTELEALRQRGEPEPSSKGGIAVDAPPPRAPRSQRPRGERRSRAAKPRKRAPRAAAAGAADEFDIGRITGDKD